ncbi:hypothetical protein [Flammeovirga pacifica]|uniref:Uncharacterized protein n=1 Tax=Flammeovirga pacifica TaxID=915059 RepID=A0A1S1Z2F3_FLAPC|nr:hypothetical protein [Flammeovirga pacifica]OHX67353.1 hypothetical protein NH26_13880 [Flammeovirga pacifica]
MKTVEKLISVTNLIRVSAYVILVLLCAKVVARITTLEVNDTVLVANVLFASILSMMIVKAYLKNRLNEVENERKRSETLEQQLLEATNLLRDMKVQNQSLKGEFETLTFAHKTLQKKHESLDKLFEETTFALEDMRNANVSLKGELHTLRDVEKRFEQSTDHFNEIILKKDSKLEELRGDLRDADETLAVQRGEIETHKNDAESWKKKYKSLTASASARGIKLSDLKIEKIG